MEILLVEDGLMDARITIEALRRCGVHHRLTLVRTIGEALQFLTRRGIFARAPRPDLVLLDLLLPDGTGVELLREIRGNAALEDLPVVVLTAAHDDDYRRECEALSVDDYITKPVDERKFLRAIHEHKRLMVFGGPSVAV